MTSVVQNVPNQTFTAATTVPFTVSATTLGNLGVIQFGCGSGGTAYTGASVADNAAGGSSTWATTVVQALNNRVVVIARCLSLKAGATTVTITPTGGSGGAYGAAAFQEVSGSGAWTEDQHQGALWPSSNNSFAVTNPGADAGATDFVVAAVCTGNGNAAAGILNPPTGYTTAAVQQDDSGHTGVQCSYRINGSAVTDSVTWTCSNNTPGDPGVLASFQTAPGAAGNLPQPWQSQGQMGVCLAS